MDYFDFPALPTVIQELITNEIVHNHDPDTWLNFALCSKSTNELVRRARPKKILDYFLIHNSNASVFDCGFGLINPIYRSKTTEELINILEKCQVKHVDFYDASFFSGIFDGAEIPQIHELIHALCEASRFATNLRISHCHGEGLFFDFYQSLKNLEKLVFTHRCSMMGNLPHFPPEIVYDSYGFEGDTSSFLPIMAEKSQHQAIKRLYIEDFVEMEDLQTFLQTAKFMKNAEIYCPIKIGDGKLRMFMTFVDDDLFEIEIFSSKMTLIYFLDVKNKCTLFFQIFCDKNRACCFMKPIKQRFNLTTASSPTEAILSNVFEFETKELDVENIVENEWIKINFESTNPRLCTHYSSQVLKNWFPRNEHETPLERINKINNILGCKITLMEPKMLKETIDEFWENIEPEFKEPDSGPESSSDSNSGSSSDSDSSSSDSDSSSDPNEAS